MINVNFGGNGTVRGRAWYIVLDAPVLTLDVTFEVTVRTDLECSRESQSMATTTNLNLKAKNHNFTPKSQPQPLHQVH